MHSKNLTLLTDLYELTMMQGYYDKQDNPTVIFDVFYRSNPFSSGYAIAAGLEQVIEYVKNLNFSYDDVDCLRSLHIYSSHRSRSSKSLPRSMKLCLWKPQSLTF